MALTASSASPHGLFLPQIRQFRAIQGEPERLGRRLFGRRAGISGRQELPWAALHRIQRPRHRRGLPGQRLPGSHDCHPSLTRAVPLDHHLTPMNLTWKRTLRTSSSERFLAQRGGDDVAAVDLHYLANGTIAGTVIILKGSGLDESNIQPLLSSLDDEFLPDVDLEHGNLTYTVVLGEVLGNWEAEASNYDTK